MLFENYSRGLETNRDPWCYNCSEEVLVKNTKRIIAFYNSEVDRFHSSSVVKAGSSKEEILDSFIDNDPKKISWNRSLKKDLLRGKKFDFAENSLITSLYRPFFSQWAYYNKNLNAYLNQMPRIFPDSQKSNMVISISGNGAPNFSAIISSKMIDVQCQFNGQCFPLYLYDTSDADTDSKPNLFVGTEQSRRYAITDEGLGHFKLAYPGEKISKEDIFYYVYGLLHSPQYRERYADNLSRELPRIPRVKSAADFWAFSKAGRALGKLHIDYENIEPYPAKLLGEIKPANFRVEKMRYGKKDGEKDLTTIHYNDHITVTGIPLEAYEYVVNGKSAIDWVVERQCVKTDKDSGIVNDANDWASETVGDPRYPLDLLLRVITVSLETMKIVKNLPKLDILESAKQEAA